MYHWSQFLAKNREGYKQNVGASKAFLAAQCRFSCDVSIGWLTFIALLDGVLRQFSIVYMTAATPVYTAFSMY